MASRTCHTERLLLLLTRLQSRERIAYGANASLTDRFAHRPRQIVLSAAITPTIDRVTYPNFFSSASFTDRVAFRTYRLQTAPFTDRTAHRPHRLQTVPGRAVRLHDLHHRLCDFSELILLPNFSPTECPSYRTHRLRNISYPPTVPLTERIAYGSLSFTDRFAYGPRQIVPSAAPIFRSPYGLTFVLLSRFDSRTFLLPTASLTECVAHRTNESLTGRLAYRFNV